MLSLITRRCCYCCANPAEDQVDLAVVFVQAVNPSELIYEAAVVSFQAEILKTYPSELISDAAVVSV